MNVPGQGASGDGARVPRRSAHDPADNLHMFGTLRLLLPVLGASAPNFLLAGLFLVTWVRPELIGGKIIAYCMLIMMLEFVVVHSSAFMGNVVLAPGKGSGEKAKAIIGLGAFYTLFVGGWALAFRTWWPLVSFWMLTLNRLLGVILKVAPSGKERELMRRGWAASVAYYLGFVMLTTLLPVPRFGITDEIIRAQGLPGSGEWISHPEKVVAFGFLYFLANGVSELFQHGWTASGIPKERDGGSDAREAA